MRSYALTLAMLLVFVSASMSHATVDVTRFSGDFVRGTGKPVTEVREFPGSAGSATIKLYNGGAEGSTGKRISSASVTVNGAVVFGPSKFNQQVGYLQATVALKEGPKNALKVLLKSNPGGKVRIEIIQQVEECGPSLVSVASDGTQGNSWSNYPSMSGDGRFVAFVSDASNLVPGATNEHGDGFVHDRQTGVTERVSVASDGTQGNDLSGGPAISADGRFVAFVSRANILVLGDTNNELDVFVTCNPLAPIIEVTIDIKPLSDTNSINPSGWVLVPVAILSSGDFDGKSDVNGKSLTFGKTGEEKSLASCLLWGIDVDRDGYKDLVCYFWAKKTGFQCGDTEGILKGQTKEEVPIKGSDSVRIVPCH